MSSPEGITTRTHQDEDIQTVVEWTLQEHWHVSYNIVKANYLMDPNGFFAACNPDGEIVGGFVFLKERS